MKTEEICPVGTSIQSLLFSKQKFTKKTAKSWADKYDFKYGKVDETENNFRLRQQEPSDFHKGTFRTIQIKDGLQAVIGCPKEKDGRKVRMAEGGGIEGKIIDFNDLSDIRLGDILVQMVGGKYPHLVQVLRKGTKDISVQNLNKVTVLPHSWEGDFVDYFRKLTSQEKSAVFGEPIVLNKKDMIEDLYKTYSKMSKFEEGQIERVLQAYLEKNNLTPIQRYQVFDEENLVYDTLDDNFVKTSYYKNNYGKGYYKKMAEGGNVEVAKTILAQLGGAGRLNAMTGAYNFIAMPNGVSFRIKNQRANYIKITLTSMDLYNLEVGRIRGNNYTVVVEKFGLYNDMLKPAIEKATGMYLSMFQEGGTIDSVREFTQEDFDKLMNSGLFSASKYMRVIVITKKGGGRFLARFNPEKNYLFINGEKDLSNPIVKWLSENSYVTESEYRKLEDGGTIDNEMENKLWDNITSGDYYDFEKGGNMPNNWTYSIGGL